MLGAISVTDRYGVEIPIAGTDTRRATLASGFVGIPTVRSSVRPQPNGSGSIIETRYTDGRLLVVEGYVRGDDAQGVLNEFRAVAKPFRESLRYGPALLRWQEGWEATGKDLQAYVKLNSMSPPDLAPGPNVIRYQVQVLSEDARVFSQVEKFAQGEALAGNTSGGGLTFPMTFPITFEPITTGQTAIFNAGDDDTPVRLFVYGSATDPQIVFDPDTRIALIGTIPAGEYLEIDTGTRKLMMNSVTPAMGMLDPGNTTWFQIPPQQNVILRTIASNTNAVARTDAYWHDAYGD